MSCSTAVPTPPLGKPLPDWHGVVPPARQPRSGRYCRLVPLNSREHGAALYDALAQDVSHANWTYLVMPEQRDAFLLWLADMETRSDPLFFVIEVDAQPVGLASYLRMDPANGVIEIGWLHFSPQLQRTPAATEALYMMLDTVFAMGYRRCEWKCNALNQPSWRAAERLGFCYEGTFRQARVDKGHNRDTAWFSILDSEWPSLAEGFARWLSPDNFDSEGQQVLSLTACRHGL